MIDYKPILVTQLKTIALPVYYEMFVDSSTPIPCITYIETQNDSLIEGDKLGYSTLSYQIKVWGNSVATLEEYAAVIDSKMRELGFIRSNANELWIDGLGQKILKYSAIAHEFF